MRESGRDNDAEVWCAEGEVAARSSKLACAGVIVSSSKFESPDGAGPAEGEYVCTDGPFETPFDSSWSV